MHEDSQSLSKESAKRIEELYFRVVAEIRLRHTHLTENEARTAANNFIGLCQLLLEYDDRISQNQETGGCND